MTLRRTPLKRKTPLARGTSKLKRSPINKVNRKRIAKLRAQQFGTDGYREHILATPCLVTGSLPVDPAHVLKTRAAGGGPEGMAPLRRDVHRAFDSSMTDERFEARYQVSRADIRAWARANYVRWLERRTA